MSNKAVENAKEGALLIFIVAVQTPYAAFVFMKLWNWFVVHVFHFEPLNMAYSIGVLIVIAYFKKHKEKNRTVEEHLKKFAIALFRISFFFLIGWIFSLIV